MPLSWTGVASPVNGWQTSHSLLLSISGGHTLVRTRFAWGFEGLTTEEQRPTDTMQLYMAWGIVTTVGDGTESVPSAVPPAGNANPPTSRWIHWEAKLPHLVQFGDTNETFLYRETPAAMPDSSEGMVAAANLGVGQTLNVWASWYISGAWEVLGKANMWYWARLGVK